MVRYVIGIDEAGRGPLAGPVAVGAVVVPEDFDFSVVKGVRDSKKLTPRAREQWYRKLRGLRRDGSLDFAVSFSSAEIIDRRGVTPAIQSALARCLKKLNAAPRHSMVLLDGSLYAPEEFTMQKTIIGGDDTKPLIAMAAIVAKVRRDRLMKRAAKRYPMYDFEVHKGYGTSAHLKAIRKIGFCELHRTTFCTRLRIGPK
jgi:ribonuclease HII